MPRYCDGITTNMTSLSNHITVGGGWGVLPEMLPKKHSTLCFTHLHSYPTSLFMLHSIWPTRLDFIQSLFEVLVSIPVKGIYLKGDACVHIIQILQFPNDNTILCDSNSLNSFGVFLATRVMKAVITAWISVMFCHEALQFLSLTVLISGLTVNAEWFLKRAVSRAPTVLD